MSEFFLELFSEEIPANLQKNTRKVLLQNFKDFFQKENISFNKCQSFSTPNRLLILFDGVKKELSLPAYDQCLKASHIFNILDARGVISVAQRAEYISRIREITKSVGEIWLKSQTK